jgi:hypothetical protein
VIPRRRRHAAWRQAASLGLVLLVGGVGVTLYNQRPANEDDLAIPIGELRSQGFELALLSDNATRGLDRRFLKAHAHQLAQSIERSRDELASLRPAAKLVATRSTALQRSAPMVEVAGKIGAARAPLDPATAAQIVAIADQLKSLEGGLKR